MVDSRGVLGVYVHRLHHTHRAHQGYRKKTHYSNEKPPVCRSVGHDLRFADVMLS
jgi:hypothetical protein